MAEKEAEKKLKYAVYEAVNEGFSLMRFFKLLLRH